MTGVYKKKEKEKWVGQKDRVERRSQKTLQITGVYKKKEDEKE